MTGPGSASIHASAVLIDRRAVLICGPSGAGKSRLAFDLILAGRSGQIPPAVLIGDDRVHLEARGGQIVVRPAEALAGLIEIRGLGIRRCAFAAEGVVGLVVDLSAADAERLPAPDALLARLHGISIPRIPVGERFAPLQLVLAALTTAAGSAPVQPADDCLKGNGNHMMSSIATE
jgi:HPr kinase/phosphorylase